MPTGMSYSTWLSMIRHFTSLVRINNGHEFRSSPRLSTQIIDLSSPPTALSPVFRPMLQKSSDMADETSFIMIKPDGVQRGIVSDIIGRFEKRGYQLVAMKMVQPTRELAETHYADLSSKGFFSDLCDFLSSSPVVAMVWKGQDIVKQGRAMIGATNPLESAPGTIRGDYAIVTGKNIIHGSDSVESAEREIALWFPNAEELCFYKKATTGWIYE